MPTARRREAARLDEYDTQCSHLDLDLQPARRSDTHVRPVEHTIRFALGDDRHADSVGAVLDHDGVWEPCRSRVPHRGDV